MLTKHFKEQREKRTIIGRLKTKWKKMEFKSVAITISIFLSVCGLLLFVATQTFSTDYPRQDNERKTNAAASVYQAVLAQQQQHQQQVALYQQLCVQSNYALAQSNYELAQSNHALAQSNALAAWCQQQKAMLALASTAPSPAATLPTAAPIPPQAAATHLPGELPPTAPSAAAIRFAAASPSDQEEQRKEWQIQNYAALMLIKSRNPGITSHCVSKRIFYKDVRKFSDSDQMRAHNLEIIQQFEIIYGNDPNKSENYSEYFTDQLSEYQIKVNGDPQ